MKLLHSDDCDEGNFFFFSLVKFGSCDSELIRCHLFNLVANICSYSAINTGNIFQITLRKVSIRSIEANNFSNGLPREIHE